MVSITISVTNIKEMTVSMSTYILIYYCADLSTMYVRVIVTFLALLVFVLPKTFRLFGFLMFWL